ncbi:NAD(P)-dependent oxidoreductase [Paraburkholderia sp. JHI869]|uniref:NAD(P)-dependent oxidoreductase n=1 Tax=Paraburkholderia sp. JHI869 TaxID=3112959 RepID=UPI003176F89C
MKVGFIGLGRMGQGMAKNLAKSDVSLLVYDANPEAVAALVNAGAHQAASVAQIAQEVDVVFTSLPGPVQVEEVVLGPQGILANMKPGLVLFELSTSSLSLNRRIHDAFSKKGGQMLDAPVSGGPAGAASGDLAIWIGGDKKVVEQHAELLRKFADKARHVGPIGAGTVAKLANNMAGYMILNIMAEVFSMAVKADIEPLELWEAMRLGVVGKQSPLLMLTKQFLPGEFEHPAFALKLGHKDMMLGTGLAKELGVPMRLANLTLEEMTEALGRGWGEQDSRAFMKLQLERAGVKIAVSHEALEAALQKT